MNPLLGLCWLCVPALLVGATPSAQVRVVGEARPAVDGTTPGLKLAAPAIAGRACEFEITGPPNHVVLVEIEAASAGAGLFRRADAQPVDAIGTSQVRVVLLDAAGVGHLSLPRAIEDVELTLRAHLAHQAQGIAGSSAMLRVLPLPSSAAPPSSVVTPSGWSGSPTTSLHGHRGGGGTGGSPVVSPKSGPVGTSVSIVGPELAALAGLAPKDVHVVGASITGFVGKLDSLSGDSATATITAGSPFPSAEPIVLKAGVGTFTSVPPFGGMSFGEPAYGWTAAPGSVQVSTGTSFKTEAQSIFDPCGEPDMFTTLRWRLEGGTLKVELPGPKSCKGDKFVIDVGYTLSDGKVVYGSIKTTAGLVAGDVWQNSSLFPLFMLTFSLLGNGTPMYVSSTNEICIEAPSGKTITSFDPISFFRVDFDPDEHVVVTETKGVDDDFAGGTEPVTPSIAWDANCAAIYPTGARDYDQTGCDRFLRDTFAGYGPGVNGRVRSAKLQVHMNGYGCQTYTDGLWFGWNGTAGSGIDWSISHVNLSTLSYQWEPGDDATLCFNLAELPVLESGTKKVKELRNVVERAAEDQFDIAIHDDTTVDYTTIKVVRCKNP